MRYTDVGIHGASQSLDKRMARGDKHWNDGYKVHEWLAVLFVVDEIVLALAQMLQILFHLVNDPLVRVDSRVARINCCGPRRCKLNKLL